MKRLERVEAIVVGDTVPMGPASIRACTVKKHYWSQHTAQGRDDMFTCVHYHQTFRIVLSEEPDNDPPLGF